MSHMWQTKHLVQKIKGQSRWQRFSQIEHTKWPLWFIINQIGHFDLTFNQINHINLVIPTRLFGLGYIPNLSS
jgi:hypothetical protein